MILVLLSLAAGTSTQTSGLLRNILGAEITVVNGTSPTTSRTGTSAPGGFQGGAGGFRVIFGAGNTLNQSVADTIGKMSGVYAVSPQLTTTGYVGGSSAFLYGIDPETYQTTTNGLNIVSGTMLSSSGNGTVVLTNTLAQSLNATVGSAVTIGSNSTGGSSYTVVGIYDPGTTFGPETRSAYILLSDAQSISGDRGKVTEIYVKANNADLVSTVASEISSAVTGVRTITASTVTGTASTLTNTLTSFFTIIGLVALMAGAFGVINTMMMSISERTREIGTLMALGAKRAQVMRIFMSEAFIIGLTGGVVGVLIGAGVSLVLPSLTGSAAGSTTVGFAGAGAGTLLRGGLQPALTGFNLVLSFALGTLVGTLAGLYPAWRASRMNPVEALRHV
jgi:putative ABC transport system permease protein